jgi:hypothetical protein
MRPILIAACLVLACLCAAPPAEAGPVRSAGRLALRAASAPLRAVGCVRANRKAARQGRWAARGC